MNNLLRAILIVYEWKSPVPERWGRKLAEGTERRVFANRQNAGALFPAQGTTLGGHSSTDGQIAVPTYSISPAHKLSVIVGSFLFLFGVFLLAARDA